MAEAGPSFLVPRVVGDRTLPMYVVGAPSMGIACAPPSRSPSRALFFKVNSHPEVEGGYVLFSTGVVRSWRGDFEVGNDDLGNIYCIAADGYDISSKEPIPSDRVVLWNWENIMSHNPSRKEEFDEMALKHMPYRITRVVHGNEVDSGFLFAKFEYAIAPFLVACADPTGASEVRLSRDDMAGAVFVHFVDEPCRHCNSIYGFPYTCFFCHSCQTHCPYTCGYTPLIPSFDAWSEVLTDYGDATVGEGRVVDVEQHMLRIVFGERWA